MKTRILKLSLLYAVVILLTACSDKNKEVKRESGIAYDVITEGIYTSIPGTLLCGGGYLVWEDPRAGEGFVHIVDAATGRELAQWGTIGQGPEELTSASVSFACPPYVKVMDFNTQKLATLKIERPGSDSVGLHTSWEKVDFEDALHQVQLDESHLLLESPSGSEPFTIIGDNGNKLTAGKYPVGIEKEVDNAFEMLQAVIAYNAKKGLLLYSSLSFPYLAMYRYDRGTLSLLWEKGEADKLSISGSELVVEKGTERGLSTIALTKDYIVAAKKDMETEASAPQRTSGRDVGQLPHSLFLYDLDGDLRRIVNVGLPIVRIAAENDSNTLYAIVVNPEFQIVRIRL